MWPFSSNNNDDEDIDEEKDNTDEADGMEGQCSDFADTGDQTCSGDEGSYDSDGYFTSSDD